MHVHVHVRVRVPPKRARAASFTRRQQRMAELKAGAARPRFGSLEQIRQSEWVAQVRRLREQLACFRWRGVVAGCRLVLSGAHGTVHAGLDASAARVGGSSSMPTLVAICRAPIAAPQLPLVGR